MSLFSTWRRAYYETPKRIRKLIGFAIFVAQAFFSFAITQSRSFFITHPTLTVGLISGFVILCLFGIVYGLASEIERLETSHHGRSASSEQEMPFTESQKAIIDKMITRSFHREQSKHRQSKTYDPERFESKIESLREQIEEMEESQLSEKDVSSIESKAEENREFIRTAYRTMKQNVDNFDPPDTGSDSGKNQDDTPSSTNPESVESERELE